MVMVTFERLLQHFPFARPNLEESDDSTLVFRVGEGEGWEVSLALADAKDHYIGEIRMEPDDWFATNEVTHVDPIECVRALLNLQRLTEEETSANALHRAQQFQRMLRESR